MINTVKFLAIDVPVYNDNRQHTFGQKAVSI